MRPHNSHVHAKFHLMTFTAVLISLLLGALPVLADDSDLLPDENNWCGTQIRFDQQMKEAGMLGDPAACFQYGACDDPSVRDPWIPDSTDPVIYIRLVIHYLANSDGTSPITTVEEIQEHIDFLNYQYLPARLQFVHTTNLIRSTAWRTLSEGEIDAMKRASAIAPDSQLNIWVTAVDFGYSYGTFPFQTNAKTATGGIVLGHFHWVGGPYSTLAHEIGHCLGLYHTFNGVDEVGECDACYEPVNAQNANVLGDRCADTPPTPTYRSCGNTPGTDPCSGFPWGYTMPENIMGYTPQTCRTMFTNQQSGRMHCWTDDALYDWIVGIKIETSQSFGPAPLAVQFTTETAKMASSWDWDFGEGGSSSDAHPFHLFEQPGNHTVTVTIETPEGPFSQINHGLISAYADTLGAADIVGQSGTEIRVDIEATNYLALQSIRLPIVYEGPLFLTYDSFSTAGLRTEYFESVNLMNIDKNNSRLALLMNSSVGGGAPPLAPGTGPILSLYFRIPSWAQTGTNPIDVSGYLAYQPKFSCNAGDYTPETEIGEVGVTCCVGNVGNVNYDYFDIVDIGDLTMLINYLFINYIEPYCMAEANCNGDPDVVVDIGDVTRLIGYLFGDSGPLPSCL